MTDAELRDMAARAAMAAMGVVPSVDPFVLQEEQRGGEANAGHHGMSSGGGGSSNPGRFELTLSEDGDSYTLENPYYDVGGRTYLAETPQAVSSSFSGVLALKVSMTTSVPQASVVTYGGLDGLQQAQSDYSYYVFPLYWLEDGAVKCDFRVGPFAIAGEFPS